MRNAQGLIRASDTRPVVHRVRHTVPVRLALPCERKDTTGHSCPATQAGVSSSRLLAHHGSSCGSSGRRRYAPTSDERPPLLRRSGLTCLPLRPAPRDPAPRCAPPPALPAGRMLNPHERRQFVPWCDRFSPDIVDNSPLRWRRRSARRLRQRRRRAAPCLRGSVAVRNAGPRLAHERSYLCHPGPARRRLRAAAPTAESGKVVRSSGPQGPLHRRPRLRHGARRRGDASAASRPPKARARAVAKVCLSAQPPADRSVQRLIRRRRWTAPASRWAARRHSCPPGRGKSTPVDAAPLPLPPPPRGHSGRHRRRCALPVRLIPLAPHPP